MKKILYLLALLFSLSTASFAQDNSDKISERMNEYVQKRLGLSKSEADRFGPMFLNYFNDLKQTNQQYKSDKLVLQQKIIDLRLRYRDQFKPIIGEKRSNDVFSYERDFVEEVKQLRKERLENNQQGRFNKRLKGPLQ